MVSSVAGSSAGTGSAAYTGNGGTVAGVAVGIPATGFGAIGATSRRFYAVRCTYDGSVGLFHNNDPAPTVASPFSTPTGTANPATGELWLSLLRRQDGAYVPRWGQGTLVGGEHLLLDQSNRAAGLLHGVADDLGLAGVGDLGVEQVAGDHPVGGRDRHGGRLGLGAG